MNDELDPLEDELVTEALLQDLRKIREMACALCGTAICGHEALMSLAMGFKNAPQCAACLSISLGHSKETLRDRLTSFITSRNCYNEGWLWANKDESVKPGELPQCLWPVEDSGTNRDAQKTIPVNGHEAAASITRYDVEWDAGDMGCGDLVLELRIRMKSIQSGLIFRLLARNPGAREDIPSWCRLTGNELVTADHPTYLIQKK